MRNRGTLVRTSTGYDLLSGISVDGELLFSPDPVAEIAQRVLSLMTPRRLMFGKQSAGLSQEEAIDKIIAASMNSSGANDPRFAERHKNTIAIAESLRGKTIVEATPTLYRLDIPDDVTSKLLDWDKPLSEQPPEVRAALQGFAAEYGDMYSTVTDSLQPFENTAGEGLYRAFVSDAGSALRASGDLARIGIPGLRYLDGSSRDKGEGTYNYVIWDQNVLDRIALLERNGEKLDALREADTAARELNQSPTVAAARAESTGKTSPITRKPIFELFDSTGASIGLTHSYDTADAAVAGHNAPKPPTPAAATYTLPPAEFQTRSNWKQVKAQQFSSLDADDGYLYHVTAAPNAAGIREKGVTPGGGETFDGGYKGYSRGKAFVTERSGVSFWVDRVEQALFHSMERPPAVVVMRIPKSKITAQLTPDDAGTKDANARAYYATDTLFQSGDAPRGRFNPDTLTVTLLKGADLSTFLHESGHFFLEVQFDLAAKLRKDAEALGADTLKPGERQTQHPEPL
jgi:hypothetical protein